MARTDSTIASLSASSVMAAKIVSRMITGGSAGFSTMIALPRLAPPSFATAPAVVRVNSSMFARVPGPAASEATDATISAYSTSVTRETARTMGIVACPPHVHVDVGQADVLLEVHRRHDVM